MPNKGQGQGISKSSCDSQKKTKSRNGCQRCKLKRLKCGEEKPACQNCVNRQVPCPGYKKCLKWSTKYEVFKPEELDLTQEFVAFQNVAIGATPVNPSIEEPASTTGADHYPSPDSDTLSGEGKSHEKKTKRQKSSVASTKGGQNDSVPVDGIITPEAGAAVDFSSPSVDDASMTGVDMFFDSQPGAIAEFSYITDEDRSFSPGDFLGVQAVAEVAELTRQREQDLCRQSQARSLLRAFYRLESSLPSVGYIDDSSYLVNYYFFNVCNIYSSFDSDLNPFRNAVKDVWTTTPSIYYAIQSMAAAQLANHSPSFEAKGVELQKKAYSMLNHELELAKHNVAASGRTMLAILLLGLTTAWHKSNDLGEYYLQAARKLIMPKLLEVAPAVEDGVAHDAQFYEESLIYWEMLMGFVTPSNAPLTRPGNRPQPDFRGADGKITPHPWTGIAPHVQMLFAEVGRLIRRERQSAIHSNSFSIDPLEDFSFTSDSSILAHSNPYVEFPIDPLLDIDPYSTTTTAAVASDLEEALLSASIPSESEINDIHDPRTDKAHFIAVADAYRYAGLLQLYRVFPALLRTRLGAPVPSWTNTFVFANSSSSRNATAFLNSLALHILSLLGRIPSDSGTICIQPILLLTAAAELRRMCELDFFDEGSFRADVAVTRARLFVEGKFELFAKKLPAKPMRVMLEACREVWRRGDAGVRDVFWLDVMCEKGWETVMG